MFFSSMGPARQPDTKSVSRPGPEWAGCWALLVDSDPPAGLLYFFWFLFFSFSVFCFADLN
jgi:hypothetical protein